MKKPHIVLFILFFLTGVALTGRAKQNDLSDHPDGADLNGTPGTADGSALSGESSYFVLQSLCFIDENNGWVIRSTRDGPEIQNTAQLLRTSDGGAHWEEVGPGDMVLKRVRFAGREEGWAITETCSGTGACFSRYARYSILHTTNGGKRWTIQWQGDEQAETTKLDLWFRDGTDGFVQIGGALYATRDGGKTWLPVSFGTDDFTLLHICFTDAETGWAAGTGPEDFVISVLHTADGGESWQRQFSTHEMTTDAILSTGIEFLNDRTGWFTALDPDKRVGELYRTDDGGLNWALINDGIGSVRPYPREIDFISDQVGWIPVDCGAGPVDGGLEYTCDGGKSFVYTEASDIDPMGARQILGVAEVNFISEQTGWAIARDAGGSVNSLLKTKDGGRTWRQVYP
jgi:photosystem II stability/assembly factor-like uncharacterized protein